MSLKRIIVLVIIRPLALLVLVCRSVWTKFRLALFGQRYYIIKTLQEPLKDVPKPRLLAVVTHIVPNVDKLTPEAMAPKLERLKSTIDGLLQSFHHCDLKIIVNTMAGMHLIGNLPEYQRKKLEIIEQTGVDPMYVEFKTTDIFAAHRDRADWFMFLEDDVVIGDSLLLEKLDFFNAAMNDPKALLVPHRYEMFNGEKCYFDLRINFDYVPFAWNRLATHTFGEFKFGECGNPHAAFHCLNRTQLELWLASPRAWNNRVSMVGPLESAATGCLFEVFRLYKPHPDNPRFLEVHHWETRYSRSIAEYDRQQREAQEKD